MFFGGRFAVGVEEDDARELRLVFDSGAGLGRRESSLELLDSFSQSRDLLSVSVGSVVTSGGGGALLLLLMVVQWCVRLSVAAKRCAGWCGDHACPYGYFCVPPSAAPYHIDALSRASRADHHSSYGCEAL